LIKNANAFIDYDNLQKKLMNFCATSMTFEGGSITFDKLHSGAMNEAINLHGFYLEFDAESLNTTTIFTLDPKIKGKSKEEEKDDEKDDKE